MASFLKEGGRLARATLYTAVDIGTDKVTSIMARVGTEGELKVLGTGVVESHGIQTVSYTHLTLPTSDLV